MFCRCCDVGDHKLSREDVLIPSKSDQQRTSESSNHLFVWGGLHILKPTVKEAPNEVLSLTGVVFSPLIEADFDDSSPRPHCFVLN